MAKKKRRAGSWGDENETKSTRFVRVVTPRVNKAIKAIGLIGNCAGSIYEHTPEQATDIFVALDAAILILQDKFAAKKYEQAWFSFADK